MGLSAAGTGASPARRRERHGLAPCVIALCALAAQAYGHDASAQATVAPAAARGVVRSARVQVDVVPTASDAADGRFGVTVRAEYELAVGDDAVTWIEVELLEHAGATGIDVVGPGGRRLDLTTASGTRRVGRVPLTPDGGVTASGAVPGAGREPGADPTAGGGSGARRVAWTFEYSVPGAARLEAGAVVLRVPVLSVSLPPVVDSGDVFTADVRVPVTWTVAEGFPSGLRSVAPGRYETTLPVVPSMVGIRGRTDGAWRPGMNLIVEVVTAVILLVFALIGWRHLGRRA